MVKLEFENISPILESFILGRLSKDQVENWASAIELREDIEFDDESKQIIDFLANPELRRQNIGQEMGQ